MFAECTVYGVGWIDGSLRLSRRRDPTLASWPPTTPRPRPNPRAVWPPGATVPPRRPEPAVPRTCRTLRLWHQQSRAHEALLTFLRDGRSRDGRWWWCCYGPWTFAVVEDRSSTWLRSPPSFSSLALTRKIHYLRAPILNLIELSPAVHRNRASRRVREAARSSSSRILGASPRSSK
jgi:hypothetical protein